MKHNKREYYEFLYENFNLSQIFEIKLDEVYKGDETATMQFKEYFTEIAKQVRKQLENQIIVRIEKIFEPESTKSV